MSSKMSSKRDPLQRFVLPDSTRYSNSAMPTMTTATTATSTVMESSSKRGPLQIPPIDRGELKAFMSTARGSSNVLAPARMNEVEDRPAKGVSLDAIWKKSLFDKAPQIADIDAKQLNRVDESGKVKIVRYLPDRFENGRVQPPQMLVEEVDGSMMHDEGDHLMHPKARRAAHDAAVNARQGELALRDGYRTLSKQHTTCRMNFPHGAIGLDESPYSGQNGVYTNAEALQAQNRAAIRRGKGGKAPPSDIGKVLTGQSENPHVRSGRASGEFRSRHESRVNFADMYKKPNRKSLGSPM